MQYPEERLTQHPRFRGEDFVWYEERCTGCASCAKYCPLGIIRIVTSPGGQQTPEGENWIDEHIDTETAPTWAGYIVVESRFVDAIIEGIVSDGLSIDNAA